jgi:phosphogluconate dehydratase
VVPLLARVYPNGSADVNQFQAAGGPGFVIRELLDAGLMHADVLTVRAGGMREYTRIPWRWRTCTSSAWQWTPGAVEATSHRAHRASSPSAPPAA